MAGFGTFRPSPGAQCSAADRGKADVLDAAMVSANAVGSQYKQDQPSDRRPRAAAIVNTTADGSISITSKATSQRTTALAVAHAEATQLGMQREIVSLKRLRVRIDAGTQGNASSTKLIRMTCPTKTSATRAHQGQRPARARDSPTASKRAF